MYIGCIKRLIYFLIEGKKTIKRLLKSNFSGKGKKSEYRRFKIFLQQLNENKN